MVPDPRRTLVALAQGSAGAGAVTSLALGFWSTGNASWAIGNFAASVLGLMGVSTTACLIGASTIGLAWHALMQSRGWTSVHVYWVPATIAGALIPIIVVGPGLIANRGTDTVGMSVTSILVVWGAALGGLTGLFSWWFRRPDRDATNPPTSAP